MKAIIEDILSGIAIAVLGAVLLVMFYLVF